MIYIVFLHMVFIKVDWERLFEERKRVITEKLTTWAALCRTKGFEMNENYIWRIRQRWSCGAETVKKLKHYGFIIDNITPLEKE